MADGQSPLNNQEHSISHNLFCSQTSSDALKQTGTFKALTGGDQVSADVKFNKNYKTFVNYAKLIFSANKIPECGDESDAFYRRWLLINFSNVFEENADRHLLEKLTTTEELSGIFNWSIEGAKRLLKRGGFEYRETEKVKEQYQRMASSLRAFVKDCVEASDENEWISKEDFYNAYISYYRAQMLPWKAKVVVSRELSEHVSVRSASKGTKERSRAWIGIKLLPLSNTLTRILPLRNVRNA